MVIVTTWTFNGRQLAVYVTPHPHTMSNDMDLCYYTLCIEYTVSKRHKLYHAHYFVGCSGGISCSITHRTRFSPNQNHCPSLQQLQRPLSQAPTWTALIRPFAEW